MLVDPLLIRSPYAGFQFAADTRGEGWVIAGEGKRIKDTREEFLLRGR